MTGRDLAKVDAVAKEIAAAGGVVETAQVDALDEKAVQEHLDIAFYTSSNFITATAAARHMSGQGSGVIVTLTALIEQGTLLKRLPTLAEVADTAAFIASDRAGAMTGTVANLSAGSITD
jgi:3-oxoacyl-[acyl-carrier protein] reductase